MRNHKLVRFKHREARSDRQFDALEERERLASTKVRHHLLHALGMSLTALQSRLASVSSFSSFSQSINQLRPSATPPPPSGKPPLAQPLPKLRSSSRDSNLRSRTRRPK